MFLQVLRRHALTAALFSLAVFGSGALTVHAKANPVRVVQAQTCVDNQTDDATEIKDTQVDTDTVDLQCGDQSTADDHKEVGSQTDKDTVQAQVGARQTTAQVGNGDAEDPATGPDTDNVQSGPGKQVEDGKPDKAGGDGESAD